MPKSYEVVVPHQISNQYHENINYERLMLFTTTVTLKILWGILPRKFGNTHAQIRLKWQYCTKVLLDFKIR